MNRNRCMNALRTQNRTRQRRTRARRLGALPPPPASQFPENYWPHLLSGSAVCLFTVLGYWHHAAWLAGSFLVSIYLMTFAVLGECPLVTLLCYALGIAPRSMPAPQQPSATLEKRRCVEDLDPDWWTIY